MPESGTSPGTRTAVRLLLLTFTGDFDTRPTFQVDTVTGDVKTYRTLTEVATTAGTPAILPDGKTMVLLRRKRSGLSSVDSVQKLDLETMSATTIVLPRTEKHTIGSPAVSPDGRLFAYVEGNRETQESCVSRARDQVDAARDRQAAVGIAPPATGFSPDKTNLEPSDYKHVALGLIFLKYISDAFEAKHAALLADDSDTAEDQDEYLADNVFWVPKDARWSHLQAKAKQSAIGKLIDDASTAAHVQGDTPLGLSRMCA